MVLSDATTKLGLEVAGQTSAGAGLIRLPSTFTPTHMTSGLDGFPAVDVFGSPGALVVAGFWGRVTRLSGHPCSDGGSPGGAYGRSVYVHNAVNGRTRYVTHLDRVLVTLGQRIKPGTVIGTVCDSAVSGKPGTTHVHLGMKR